MFWSCFSHASAYVYLLMKLHTPLRCTFLNCLLYILYKVDILNHSQNITHNLMKSSAYKLNHTLYVVPQAWYFLINIQAGTSEEINTGSIKALPLPLILLPKISWPYPLPGIIRAINKLPCFSAGCVYQVIHLWICRWCFIPLFVGCLDTPYLPCAG